MIIDFHSHIFPEKIAGATIKALTERSNGHPSTDGTAGGLILAMERANADVCVTLPVLTKPTQFDSVLRFACEINEKYKNNTRRIISFAGMHPALDDIDNKMKTIKELGIKGVKIHPDYQATFIDDPGYIQILNCAKKYDLIVVTHSGIDDGYVGEPVRCPPERVLKVIREVNHEKFVLGHYGAHKQWNQALEILAGENVYFDTAFTFHEIEEKTFKAILNKHGANKVLFATDCPWRDIKDDVEIFKSYNLGQNVEEKILFKNACALLGI